MTKDIYLPNTVYTFDFHTDIVYTPIELLLARSRLLKYELCDKLDIANSTLTRWIKKKGGNIPQKYQASCIEIAKQYGIKFTYEEANEGGKLYNAIS